MRLTRVHVAQGLSPGDRVTLPEAATLHLLRVLRAGVGDACVLFNGDGLDYDARIVAAGRRGAEVEVLAARTLANEPPLRIELLQAVVRGEKMDWILQKATELGAAAFVPVTSERSEVRLDAHRAARRVGHWRSVVVAACEQSGRACVPTVALPVSVAEAVAALRPGSRRLLLDPDAGRGLPRFEDAAPPELVLAIGPEGGWSPHDMTMLRTAGFEGMRLGPRVLRTETAGIAAIAALLARCGDFA